MIRRAFSVVALAVLGVTLLFYFVSRHSGGVQPTSPQELQHTDASQTSIASGDVDARTQRSEVRSFQPLRVTVLDASRTPVAGATVSRLVCPRDWARRLTTWPTIEERDLQEEALTATTDSYGSVDFNCEKSTEPAEWLVVARAPGKRIEWMRVKLTGQSEPISITLTLQESPHVQVTVLHQDGGVALGATVTERVDLCDWPLLDEDEQDARHCDMLPVVHGVTDARGLVEMPALCKRMWIQATDGGLQSSAWTGAQAGHITLVLADTCTAEGTVSDSVTGKRVTGGMVSCQVRRGLDQAVVALLPVSESGTFGPIVLPLASTDGFLFQFVGGDYEASQVLLPPPLKGEHVTADIRTSPGVGVALQVHQQGGAPLAGVTVAVQWTRGNVWHRIDRVTNKEGKAFLSHLPSGQVWVRSRKPGYVPSLNEMYRAEDWVRHVLSVTMMPAASIEGRCTSGGKPVKDFTVLFWHSEVRDGGRISVQGSEDGVFRIEEAAPGLVQLLASSDAVVQSAHYTLEVNAGDTGHLDIEMPLPREVRGEVVDATSGVGLPGAAVCPVIISGGASVRPWKTAIHADSEGHFVLTGLGDGEGRLSISAPGYAARDVTVWPSKTGATQLGAIALYRSQQLVVRLRSSNPVEYSSYGVSLTSTNTRIPGVRCSAEGVAAFDSLTPGTYQVQVEASNGDTVAREIKVGSTGRSECLFDLTGSSVDIEVVPPDGCALDPEWNASLSYHAEGIGQIDCGYALPSSGVVHIGNAPSGPAMFTIVSSAGDLIASVPIVFPSPMPKRMQIHLDPIALRIRVLDSSQRPIPGAKVFCRDDENGVSLGRLLVADEKGEVLVRDRGMGRFMATAYHTDIGGAPCVEVVPSLVQGGVVNLVISDGVEVNLELRDGMQPIHGVGCEITDTCGSTVLGVAQVTDADGLLRFQRLAPGDYRVVVDHPGIWRTEQPITVTPTSTNFTVQLRRIGAVRIRAKSGVGNAVEGATIELVDVATGTRVQDWMTSGDVPTPANGLKTDSSGTVVVQGLPRGSYRCVATTSAGGVVERTIEVPAQATGEVEIVVP